MRLEGYDTGDIYEFSSLKELVAFLDSLGEWVAEQTLIYVNRRPAFIRR